MTGRKYKSIFLLLIIFAFILAPSIRILAKDPQFLLNIDSSKLQKGQSTRLTLSMVNARGAKLSQIIGLENFDVLSTNQSTSTQIINGDMTYENSIIYVIMPKNIGQFTLEGIVEYNGNTYKTNQLNINVSEAEDLPQENISDLFVKTVLSDSEVYLGQKSVLTYVLYSRYNIEGCRFMDNIEIDGFMINDVTEDKLKGEYVYLEGKKYAKYEVKKTYLTPIKPGTFTIPEYNLQVNISTRISIFSDTEYLKTDAKQLTVKPLPENKPADFSGLVGELNLQSEYSRLEVPYGDSLTLKVTASGSCDLSVLDKITKNGINGFTVYETEKNMEEGINDNKYWSKKEYEIILVPEKSGEIKIDPIYISYFDTKSGTYKQAEIPGTTITVTGNAPQSQMQVQNNTAPTIAEKVVIDRISYIPKDEGYLILKLKKSHIIITFILFAILAIFIVLSVLLTKYFNHRDKRLSEMYKQIGRSKDKNEFYDILNNMIKYRFNLSIKASPKDLIKTELAKYNLSDPVIEIIDYIENGKNNTIEANSYLKGKMKELYKKIIKI
ncbi:BatD family protein [Acetivibrio clariflavus]|uniref:Oxygen tolerance n=1 Tax=Acetivibrio clariflavus (strain DSM 19732 / NBRC 101661 / EBR45) TaxID=720554 RepID=G8LZE1_ACECE|nr:BatD family protein [Acetivibrio clariflavus]AEV66804.1 hypothetical protein Clocl_0046 [Acetivibrio clariflavus DSM 19732]